MSTDTAQTAWASGMRAVHEDAAGVVQVTVVTPESLPELMLAAAVGDAGAMTLCRMAVQALRDIMEAPRHRSALCGTCDRGLAKAPFALAVAVPSRDHPRHALAIGICCVCAPLPRDVKPKATEALRHLWPDLREIEVHGQAGAA